MCLCVCVHVSACVSLASAQASSSTSLWKQPLFWFGIIQLIATSPSPLLNVTICQPSPFVFFFSSLPLPLIPPFLSLPPLSLLPFPAHPIWSLTPHSCSSFNEDLSPSHARTYTHYSNTSHTQLPWMRLCVQHACTTACDKAWNMVYMQINVFASQHCTVC